MDIPAARHSRSLVDELNTEGGAAEKVRAYLAAWGG